MATKGGQGCAPQKCVVRKEESSEGHCRQREGEVGNNAQAIHHYLFQCVTCSVTHQGEIMAGWPGSLLSTQRASADQQGFCLLEAGTAAEFDCSELLELLELLECLCLVFLCLLLELLDCCGLLDCLDCCGLLLLLGSCLSPGGCVDCWPAGLVGLGGGLDAGLETG